jgi:hypothetical protein
MARSLTLNPIADIYSYTRDGKVVAFDVGADGYPYIVVADEEVEHADEPHTYRVLRVAEDEVISETKVELMNPPALNSSAGHVLNVESDAVAWLYNVADSALVHLRNGEPEETWEIPAAGYRWFSILGEWAVFGGSGARGEQYSFFKVPPGRDPKLLGEFTVELHEAKAPAIGVGRGGTIWLLSKDLLYRLRVDDAQDALE